jgi:hypothetical protein
VVAQVADAHADLLEHLAMHALFGALARIDEASERAVHARREVARAREQHLGASLHAHDHRGREPRILLEATRVAHARA